MKKSIYNIAFGIFGQIIALGLGVLVPRLVIVSFGSEINGLLASVNQFFVYIALLEAGVGAASLQALYKPVALNDNHGVNGILAATHKYYKRTGIVVTAVVLVFAVLYPLLINTNIPFSTVALVIALTGSGWIISYLFQGKYKLLLIAEGKTYILTNLETVVIIMTQATKIGLILLGFDIVIIQVSYFVFHLVRMLYLTSYIRRKYKWIDLKTKPNLSALSQKNAVLVHQVSELLFNNVDIIILTFFVGLKSVSIYALYMVFFNAINTMIGHIRSGFVYKLAQTFNTNLMRYKTAHEIFELFYITLIFALYCILYIFLPPFLKLYTVGFTDAQYIDKWLPLLFVLVKLLSSGRDSSNQVIYYAGHFQQTKWRAIIEITINLIVSLVLVFYIGIYGVLIGTIVALLYRSNDMILYASAKILNRSSWITYRRWLVNAALFIVVVACSSLIKLPLSSYFNIALYAAIYSIVILSLFYAVNFLIEKQNAKKGLQFLTRRIYQSLKNLKFRSGV